MRHSFSWKSVTAMLTLAAFALLPIFASESEAIPFFGKKEDKHATTQQAVANVEEKVDDLNTLVTVILFLVVVFAALLAYFRFFASPDKGNDGGGDGKRDPPPAAGRD